jgi:hypothetical protein
MKRASCLVVALLLSACGAGGEATGEGETPSAAPAEPSATGPVYDLHEWGVVAVRPGGFEVAAGAGQPRMELNVDKPVLYVHSDEPAPFPLTVQVNLPDALHPVEHFPPTDLRPLRWRAEVGTAGCRGQYPGATDVLDARCLDGYCEVYELARYETTDARCLTVGAASAPLLFYRLWAPISPPALPLGLTLENDEVVVTRSSPRAARRGPSSASGARARGRAHQRHPARGRPAHAAPRHTHLARLGGLRGAAHGAHGPGPHAHPRRPRSCGAGKPRSSAPRSRSRTTWIASARTTAERWHHRRRRDGQPRR